MPFKAVGIAWNTLKWDFESARGTADEMCRGLAGCRPLVGSQWPFFSTRLRQRWGKLSAAVVRCNYLIWPLSQTAMYCTLHDKTRPQYRPQNFPSHSKRPEVMSKSARSAETEQTPPRTGTRHFQNIRSSITGFRGHHNGTDGIAFRPNNKYNLPIERETLDQFHLLQRPAGVR